MTDVSVIIVNYNTREHLLRCLESVIIGNKVDASGVFVIDNGSSDGSVVAARQAYPAINLIANQQNTGFAFAVNQGLRQAGASYKFHLIVNTDVTLQADYAERLAAFMRTHPQAGIATGQLLDQDDSLQRSIDNLPTLMSELLGKSVSRLIMPLQKQAQDGYFVAESVIGAAMIVRQQAIEQVGLLDEDYFLFLEETDWCGRMRQNGWQVCLVPAAKAYHLQGQTKKSVLVPARIEYLKSMYLFFRKHYSPAIYYLYRILKPARILAGFAINLLACVLTLFLVGKVRRILINYGILLWWHIRLCDERMTLGYLSKNRE